MAVQIQLPAPALYTPWKKGIYEVAPSLRPFGTDFGNGQADLELFQFDSESTRYLQNKRAVLQERSGKYYCQNNLSPQVEHAVCTLIRTKLTGNPFGVCPETATSLPELALLIPEDFVVVSTERQQDGSLKDWVSFIHICSPSHWVAEEKVGRSFFEVHTPIPDFDRVNAVAPGLVDAMVKKGPFVRFVWGVESDDRLNHHPEPPPGEDFEAWSGRNFSQGRFWVRTERQVIWGLPEVGAALFSIRVGFVPDSVVLASSELRTSLKAALLSMSPAARAYKGLDKDWDRLMKLL